MRGPRAAEGHLLCYVLPPIPVLDAFRSMTKVSHIWPQWHVWTRPGWTIVRGCRRLTNDATPLVIYQKVEIIKIFSLSSHLISVFYGGLMEAISSSSPSLSRFVALASPGGGGMWNTIYPAPFRGEPRVQFSPWPFLCPRIDFCQTPQTWRESPIW